MSMFSALTPRPDFLAVALAEIGVKEVSGSASNPRIDEYLLTVGLSGDETPWCAAFVNWVLMKCGVPGTGAANARSFLKWGMDVPLKDAKPGDIVVFSRGSKSWQGHVAFFKGRLPNGKLLVVGGNQSNSVCEEDYGTERLLGVRRMMRAKDSTTVAAGLAAGALTTAKAAIDIAGEVSTTVSTAHTAVKQGAETVAKARETARELRDAIPTESPFTPPFVTVVEREASPSPSIAAGQTSGSAMISIGLTVIIIALIAYIIVERVRKLRSQGK